MTCGCTSMQVTYPVHVIRNSVNMQCTIYEAPHCVVFSSLPVSSSAREELSCCVRVARSSQLPPQSVPSHGPAFHAHRLLIKRYIVAFFPSSLYSLHFFFHSVCILPFLSVFLFILLFVFYFPVSFFFHHV